MAQPITSNPASDNARTGLLDQWAILGAMRFFLAFVVLCAHAAILLPWRNYSRWAVRLDHNAAVVGFLMISGYSIAASVGRGATTEFAIRRMRRILPLYWCAIAYTFAIWCPEIYSCVVTHRPLVNIDSRPSEWIGSALMLQLLIFPAINCNAAIWSLSLECFYYAMAPTLNRLRPAWTVGIICASALLGLHYAPYGNLPAAHDNFARLVLLAWAWVGGFALQRSGSNWKSFVLLVAASLVVWHNYTNEAIALLTGTSAIMFFAPKIRLIQPVARFATYLGDISYPLYLFQMPTLLATDSLWPTMPHWIPIANCIAVSCAVHHWVDSPIRAGRCATWNRLEHTVRTRPNLVPARFSPAKPEQLT